MNLSIVGRQPQDKPRADPAVTVTPVTVNGKRKAPRLTALNLATLAFIAAYLVFDWWAIAYLISH